MDDGPGVQQEHDFRVDVERANGSAPPVISVSGDMDLHSAPELRDRLGDLVDGGVSRVLLDLSRTTFLDSMALGVLLSAKKRMTAAGGDLELVVSTPDVRRIFEITMLDRVFTLHESRAAATSSAARQLSSASSSDA